MEISVSASLTSSGFVPRLLPLFYPQAQTTSCKPSLSSSSIRLSSSHRRLAPSRCLADQSAFTGINVVDSDPIDAVKRKVMDIAPELKGASIFLVGINSPIKTNSGKLLAEALRYYYFDRMSKIIDRYEIQHADELKALDLAEQTRNYLPHKELLETVQRLALRHNV